ncbi:phosphoribosylamine--glycine ligase [Candidatus Tachikawaea gelatinosa]|uniref:Phosphoribosylamine--glycine ligase n=1 Tax=Candidatus Tachikawaea gelatinosa TaxID=1410383 RepID=A0A090BWH2_9ENTR|nr:phosphoribosylamine--glycine ligase [Candidatus Tachikawaea gelatinosa]BAP58601.1 phosphoribosylamine--glycine ligase [Candidatus Tachikawaea gelatinosa]
MKILIIGNGGREHALAWKIQQSYLAKKVFIAPGNGGTQLEKKIFNIDIPVTNINALVMFAKREKIHLTIVGSEIPLNMGIVDAFVKHGLKIFGPTKKAAQLESSKLFGKKFLLKYKIPTARYKFFDEPKSAINFVEKIRCPIVIKVDGLAAGKGVMIVHSIHEAKNTIEKIMVHKIFGNAGKIILIEEFILGEEVSFIGIIDGKVFLPVAMSQDHKRIGENDSGANTGGMGAYSPVPFVTKKIYKNIIKNILTPTLKGLRKEKIFYTGFLYIGLMINKFGYSKVVEFNCRLGDPETQVILIRLRSDLLKILIEAINHNLYQKFLVWNYKVAICTIIASRDYPNKVHVGEIIQGYPQKTPNDIKIFHSSTMINKKNLLVTTGGRVLCVTALGKNIIIAKKNVDIFLKKIYWENSFFRRDIGFRIIKN